MFEFQVKLLFLLNQELLLHDFLRLGDETFLQRVDLLDHFVRARVAAFQFSPAVNVHRVLEFLLQGLAARPLTKELSLDVVNLPSEETKYGIKLKILVLTYHIHTVVKTSMTLYAIAYEVKSWQCKHFAAQFLNRKGNW